MSLPTLYEYYTGIGITNGLSIDQSYFKLNEKNLTIYSGSMHYFRVPPEYWRDRLRKLRAAGLNTVETYIPWNLHEPQDGQYDFGNGNSDFQEFLNIEKFLKIAQEEDLFAIIRPGPYICSEWEFGGFPSWLLRYTNIKLRTSDEIYMKFVKRFFNLLLPILAMLQFTNGGPIIGFQVENEYGSTERKNKFIPDLHYLHELRQLMIDNKIVELLMTSDSPSSHRDVGTLPGLLFQTANFASDPEKDFTVLESLQPNKPIMAMEFWTGWFDHWSETHHKRSDNDFKNVLERILKYPASVNMYMFIGGTSWGFMNGANVNSDLIDNSNYQPDITSYDYDAPLSESGDYTYKYVIVKELLNKYNNIKTSTPELPHIEPKKQYDKIQISGQLFLDEIIEQIPTKINSYLPLSMEQLPINNFSGQSYGYIIYRLKNLTIPANSNLKISGHIRDTLMILINGYPLNKPLKYLEDLNGFGYWRLKNSSIILNRQDLYDATIDLVIENLGRVNFGYLDQYHQFKGLWKNKIYLNDKEVNNFEIIPMEFKKNWNNNLKGWHTPIINWPPGPALYYATLTIDECRDTFINMKDWIRGIVIVNGFVLGRYAQIGPQQTLYLPGPFLHQGNNSIIIFEHFIPDSYVTFTTKPYWYTVEKQKKKSKIPKN